MKKTQITAVMNGYDGFAGEEIENQLECMILCIKYQNQYGTDGKYVILCLQSVLYLE